MAFLASSQNPIRVLPDIQPHWHIHIVSTVAGPIVLSSEQMGMQRRFCEEQIVAGGQSGIQC